MLRTFWKRWLILAAPVVLLIGLLVAPSSVRTRFQSIFHSRENEFRLLVGRKGEIDDLNGAMLLPGLF